MDKSACNIKQIFFQFCICSLFFKNIFNQGINIYWKNDIILGIINHIYHVHSLLFRIIFCKRFIFICRTTVYSVELLLIIQFGQQFISQIKSSSIILGLYKIKLGFCRGRDEERGKGFASNGPAAIQFRGENVDYQNSKG